MRYIRRSKLRLPSNGYGYIFNRRYAPEKMNVKWIGVESLEKKSLKNWGCYILTSVGGASFDDDDED